MKQQDCIIVLHYTRCSDNAVMLHALSERYGRKSFLVRSTSKYINYFQPLNILDCDLSSSGKSSIMNASSFRENVALTCLRSSYVKNAISMFLSEVLYRTLEEDATDQGVFDWCRKEILLLDGLERDFSNFHLLFLLEYCSLLGFSPSEESLMPFSEERHQLLCRLIATPYDEALLLPLSGDDRSEICARLLRYLAFHLEKTVNVRSLDVLSELF